ncbi:transporter [Methylophilus aquaticus]|uniref:Transporter n=1 Tax=Methylophilus aquaticus TaxID=1971610 RepID=A0ABT9JVH7_9PROT|nr:transporter [Methylophilus aquaticus]MDP8568521.1 transporter [Methylophilus aquaticus]
MAATAHATDSLPTASYFGLDTMAPDSSWAIRLEQRSNQYDARYDDNGHRIALGDSFNAVNLDAGIFPALSLLGAGASLGNTRFKTKTSNQISTLTIGYGLTPDLTIGAIIPYAFSYTKATFAVDGGNVGFNPGFDASQAIGAGNFPFAPAGGGIAPMSTAGVQDILTNPAFGYQYKAIKDNRTEGFSDPTLGVLWRALKSPGESLIIGLGLRLGVARKDDPDDLLDTPLGDGSNDVRSRFEYFRDLGGNVDLRLLADYNWQTSDKARMRVPGQGQLLALASSKQTLHRDLGDYYEADIELGYRWSNWRFAGTWHRYEKKADAYHSSLGTNTDSLETNTYTRADQYRISAAWSGIQAWQQGKLPLPLIVKLEIQDTFAGRNFVDVQDIYLQVMTLFK